MPETRSRRRLAWSTAIFSLATGLSRVLGLVREIFAANYFGVSGRINAFTIAFQLPNLVRALVADAALSSAFVPVFTELLEQGDRKRAWRVASSLFWIMLLGLGALSALFILLAPIAILPFGDPGGDKALAANLARVLFPIVALLGASGIVVGILNTYDQFSVPALTPVAWNLAIILGLVLGVPHASGEDAKLYVYAASILAGTVIQVLMPLPWLRGLDDRLRVVVDWKDPAVKRVFKMMLPVTLGLGLINFNAFVDSIFASRLIDANLAPAAIDKAFRIYMLPQGMFSVAVATVLFPTLARFAARSDMEGFTGTVARGVRQIGFMLIPASVVSAVLAEPMVRLVYQRGAFESNQTPVVAACLAAFSAGLTFNGAMLMLNRAFFSLQQNWLPTWVALGNLGLNALLDGLFYHLGAWGIPLATSVVNVAGTAALLVLLRRRVGRLGFGETVDGVVRITVASGVAGGLGWLVWWLIDRHVGRSTGGQIFSLGLGLAAAVDAYLAACILLRVREIGPLLSLRARVRRPR